MSKINRSVTEHAGGCGSCQVFGWADLPPAHGRGGLKPGHKPASRTTVEVSWPLIGGTDKHITSSFWVSRIVPGPWKRRVGTELQDSFRVRSEDYSLQSCFQGHGWVLLGPCAGRADSINRQRTGLDPGMGLLQDS